MAYKADNDWLEIFWIVVIILSIIATNLTIRLIESLLGCDLQERIGDLCWIAGLIFFAAYVILFRFQLLYKQFEAAKNDPFYGMRGDGVL